MLLPRLTIGVGLVTPIACTSALTSALAHEVINDLQQRTNTFVTTGVTAALGALYHSVSSKLSDRAHRMQDTPWTHPVEGGVLEVQRLARRAFALLACDDRLLHLQLQATAITRSSCVAY